MPNLSSITVANRFIKLGIKNNKPVTQLDIYKLSYFAHGLSLAMYNEPLLSEQFEAWPFGPVLRSLYKGALLGRRAETIRGILPEDFSNNNNLIDQDTRIIDSIYRIMIDRYRTGQLSDKTHTQDGAWHRAYRDYTDEIIRNEDIRNEWVNNTNGDTIEDRIASFNRYSDNIAKV